MYSSNSRTRTVYCSSKKSSWSGSWLIILSSSIFISSVFYTDQLLFIWHVFVLWSVQRGVLQLWMFTLKPFLIKINLRLKWCNQTLQLGTLTVQSSPLDFFHGHRFVLNLEIRPSFVFCWRGEGGHQSRLKGVFFKLYSARGISQQHKSTFFTSLSMELTLGQASLALGHCRYYR